MIVDLLLIILLIAYTVSGFRQGLVVGRCRWVASWSGAVLAIWLVPAWPPGSPPGFQRSAIIVVCVLLAAWVGQYAGALSGALGAPPMSESPARLVAEPARRVAGLVAWRWCCGSSPARCGPARSRRWPRAISSSRVLAAIDRIVPSPLASLAEDLRSTVAGSAFPRVFAGSARSRSAPIRSPDPAIASDEWSARPPAAS